MWIYCLQLCYYSAYCLCFYLTCLCLKMRLTTRITSLRLFHSSKLGCWCVKVVSVWRTGYRFEPWKQPLMFALGLVVYITSLSLSAAFTLITWNVLCISCPFSFGFREAFSQQWTLTFFNLSMNFIARKSCSRFYIHLLHFLNLA